MRHIYHFHAAVIDDCASRIFSIHLAADSLEAAQELACHYILNSKYKAWGTGSSKDNPFDGFLFNFFHIPIMALALERYYGEEAKIVKKIKKLFRHPVSNSTQKEKDNFIDNYIKPYFKSFMEMIDFFAEIQPDEYWDIDFREIDLFPKEDIL